MKKQSRRVLVLAGLLIGTAGTSAQQRDSQSQDALVREALERYQAGLDAIQNGAVPNTPPTAQGPQRRLARRSPDSHGPKPCQRSPMSRRPWCSADTAMVA